MKSNLITRGGHQKLEQELKYLWRDYRPKITEKVAWAASLGDRSENADYKENKRLLRQIDSRIRYLQKRLDVLKIVDYSPQQEGKVFFGAEVVVENESHGTKKFQIVGPDEIYGSNEFISIDSPMARALIGKAVWDKVVVDGPKISIHWRIISIEYHIAGN